ncbi:TIR domain-containing protein [Actinomycetospora rhizophila]|uniref:TIR domain-containing protein n=1 Tax=Actinomycetospora rhizophila TaxID=1416876 RepID=A0ABV9ZHW4_9PSEU
MARVFVSHASADRGPSGRLRRWLVDAGHDVFLDRDPQDGITPGEKWEERLYASLRWADVVVCVVTEAYCRSAWCTAEVVIARSQGARLLPMLAEPGVRHELLQSLQNLDLTKDQAAARDRLDAVLREIDVAGGRGWPDDLSPYPGLDPFDADRHRAFFGREDDVRTLVSALRTPSARSEAEVLVVVGPSGCGKSSLVRAGLVPAVASEPDAWALAPCRPGRDPLGAVVRELAMTARSLGRPERSIPDLRQMVHTGGLADVVDDLLLAVPGGRRDRLLVVVDQFEELLTQADAAARADFARVLLPALGRPLQVVATLRPEFLDRLLSSAELADLPTRVHTIAPMRREGLVAAIVKPAQLAGLELDEGLVDRLVADTGGGDALPLLAYTLAQLTEGAARNGIYRHAQISLTRYDQLGGVRGALAQQADRALADAEKAGGRDRDAVVRELLGLVVVDEQGRPVRWRVPWHELSVPAARELDEFVRRRLLTTHSEPSSSGAVVEVAHEAFLSAWPPLAEAIDRESTALRARRLVEQAAGDWAARGGGTGGLWEGAQLAGVVADLGARPHRTRPGHRIGLATDQIQLSPGAREFLLTSVIRDRRRRHRAVAVLSILLLVAVVAGVAALLQARSATSAQRQAVARQLLTQADAARATDTRAALRLGLAAAQIAPDPAADANLVDTLSHTRYARTLPHTSEVTTTAYSPDGSTMVTGGMDGSATIWDLTDPSRPTQIGAMPVQRGYVYDITFSPDGRTLATTGSDTTVGLWDITDRAAPRPLGTPLTGHSAEAHAVAFSPDGHTLASVGFDGRLILRDVTDPRRSTTTVEVPTGHAGHVYDVAYAPDGRTLATAGADDTVRLWNVTDRTHPSPLGAPLAGASNAVWSTAFAPTGATVSAVDQSGELVTWSTDGSGRLVGAPVRVHAGAAYQLAFSPDGTMLATAGADHEVGLFTATDLTRPMRIGEPLRAHADQVYTVAFAPHGRWLTSAGPDRTTVLWDLAGPPHPVLLSTLTTGGAGAGRAVAVTPPGRLLATGGQEPAVRLWDLADVAHPRPSGPPIPMPADVGSLAISPDGRLLAAGTNDGSVALVVLEGSGMPRIVGTVPAVGGAVNGVAFAPDGARLAVARDDRSVSLWNIDDPTRPAPDGGPVVVHTGPVYSAAFSADGHTLVTAGAEGAVVDWDVSGPGAPRPIPPGLTAGGPPVFSVAFDPDGTLASGGWDGSVLVWDRSTPGAPRRTPAPSTDGGAIYTVGFDGDGATLAAAGSSGSITLWDVSVPAAPRPLGPTTPTAGSPITALTLPHDRPWLVAAGADGVVRLWDVSALDDLRAHPTARACAIVARGVDPNEWAAAVPDLEFEDTCPAAAEPR